MAGKTKLKEAFDVQSTHAAFYTGGNVEWYDDTLYCQCGSHIALFDIQTGVVKAKAGQETSEDVDVIQTFTADSTRIVTSHKSGLLKLWSADGTLQKMWKYIHKGTVACLILKERYLATGGSDGGVRIWDLSHYACILSYKGCVGVVNVITFHPSETQLLASGDDGKIVLWNMSDVSVQTEYEGHLSKVTSIVFHYDKRHFITSGRDKVLMLWALDNPTAISTIPVYETIESLIVFPKEFELPNLKATAEDKIYVACGGENARVRIWEMTERKEIYVQSNSLISKSELEGGLAIVKLLHNNGSLAVVSADQNIMLHDLHTFACTKQFVGYADEILDLCFVGKCDSHLVVATNSADLKLYEDASMTCQILKGHTDLVLSVVSSNTNRNLFMSSAKDNTIRLWILKDSTAECIAVGMRHTASVDTTAFGSNFIVSGSEDTCVKVWDLPDEIPDRTISLNCKCTEIAHEKGINNVTVSPNDKIIATASQDKTAKLWSSDTLLLLGTLRGHRRGIWCVRFSPVDQVVATSSTDSTIKLWSITELNCLKTIEGHNSSVHRLEFLSNGLQILSVGADGLIKLFNVKTSEAVTTCEEHDERVWALALRADESGFVSGGADSVLIKWKDVTEERKQQKLQEEEELIVVEQQLSNYLESDNLLKALQLVLRLERPLQTLRIIQSIMRKGDGGLADTVKALRNDQKEALFKCATDWNTNSKNCHPAQLVLSILIEELQTGEFKPVGIGNFLDGAIPYTDRHFRRLTQTLQDLHFISYTINCMQPHAKNVGN